MVIKVKSIYVVFSATPYKMGRFIRGMTGNRWNHVSVSLSPQLAPMYSFARVYRNTPFFAGFIHESLCRYSKLAEKDSEIRVCRVPVPDERYERVSLLLSDMSAHKERYLYNYVSAAFALFGVRLNIHGAYTCAEFAGDVLNVAGLEISYGAFHEIDEMAHLLSAYTIYEGESARYPTSPSWGDDRFPQSVGLISGMTKTASGFAKLTARGAGDAVRFLYGLTFSYVRSSRDD